MTVKLSLDDLRVNQTVFTSDSLPDALTTAADWMTVNGVTIIEDVVAHFDYEHGEWSVVVYWTAE